MDIWEKPLSGAACRITQPRMPVIHALWEAEIPLSPYDILERARGAHHALGLVRRVHMEDGRHAYLPASSGHSHVIICQRCGRAAEFSGGDDLSALQARVEAVIGYCVDDHLLQFTGHCPGCQQDPE